MERRSYGVLESPASNNRPSRWYIGLDHSSASESYAAFMISPAGQKAHGLQSRNSTRTVSVSSETSHPSFRVKPSPSHTGHFAPSFVFLKKFFPPTFGSRDQKCRSVRFPSRNHPADGLLDKLWFLWLLVAEPRGYGLQE